MLQTLMEPGLREPDFSLECLMQSLSSRYLLLTLPVLAALPYAGSFVEDLQSRFLRSYLPRAGLDAFLRSRTMATALSGAAVMAAGALLTAAVLFLLLMPREMRPDPLMQQDFEAARLALAGDIAAQELRLMLSGSLWALVGAAAAATAMNRYLALAVPFIAFYSLLILSTRYLPDLGVLNPENWIAPSEVWGPLPLGGALFALELAVGTGFTLLLVMGRRLRDA